MNNKWIDWYWENPLKTYNKIKKYFRPIKTKYQWTFGFSNKAKLLELNAFDVTWKSKWDEPRHEYNPRIFFSLFNYIHLYIEWTLKEKDSMCDMVYWEAALWWLYFNKSLPKAIDAISGWQDYNKETNTYENIKFTLLKEPWQTMYNNNELPKIKYEGNIKD